MDVEWIRVYVVCDVCCWFCPCPECCLWSCVPQRHEHDTKSYRSPCLSVGSVSILHINATFLQSIVVYRTRREEDTIVVYRHVLDFFVQALSGRKRGRPFLLRPPPSTGGSQRHQQQQQRHNHSLTLFRTTARKPTHSEQAAPSGRHKRTDVLQYQTNKEVARLLVELGMEFPSRCGPGVGVQNQLAATQRITITHVMYE